jgi:hypothetical protein
MVLRSSLPPFTISYRGCATSSPTAPVPRQAVERAHEFGELDDRSPVRRADSVGFCHPAAPLDGRTHTLAWHNRNRRLAEDFEATIAERQGVGFNFYPAICSCLIQPIRFLGRTLRLRRLRPSTVTCRDRSRMEWSSLRISVEDFLIRSRNEKMSPTKH